MRCMVKKMSASVLAIVTILAIVISQPGIMSYAADYGNSGYEEFTVGTYNSGTGSTTGTVAVLQLFNGKWVCLKDGAIDTSYTGLAKNSYGLWYVKNGVLDLTYTGMVPYNSTWIYMKEGKFDSTYTGLAKNSSGVWYMKKGMLDLTYTGLAKNAYGIWYVKNGKVDLTYTGMAKNSYGLWYVKKGKLDSTYTGMVVYDGKCIYVNKGRFDSTYTGLAKNASGVWYIKNGILDLTYTGLAKNSYGLWYMNKGKLDTTFNGTVSYNGKAYTVTKGKAVEDDSREVLDNIVVGINEKYIGEGYADLVASAFNAYLAKTNYTFNIEYRKLGDSETTVAELGNIINTASDIDFVLAAGANIETKGGVDVVSMAKMLDDYNSDGKRYGAILKESMSTALFYYFVTGDLYHYYDNENDDICNICGAKRSAYTDVVFENGVNVNFIKGYDTDASNTPVIKGGNTIVFTADTDSKDEVWEISLGDNKLEPNKNYTVQFSLFNSTGNIGIGCVRDEYISEIYGVNTFYGNFTDSNLGATDGYKIRVRRGFYEISDITGSARKNFPYSEAYVDANGYIKVKMDVTYNGTTYISNIYYLNKSSEWIKFDEAYVGISSSNTFGLYILHGSTSKCVAAIKDVKYLIEDRQTTYSEDVATPAIKLIDYNVQTGNSYYTMTANWLKSESPDIIGLQEVGPGWYTSLKNNLGSTYGYVGTPRSGTSSTNSGNEASPIFYKKSEYSLIKSGTKWLSSTPDVVGSRISGSEYIRVMTYVVLYHKDTGSIYIYVNTHLDNASAGSVRVNQINILMDIVDDLPNYPTVLTGDLNGGLSSQVITRIQSGFGYTNLARQAAVKTSTYTTSTFWETDSPTVIDYIFLSDMNKFNALSYMVGNNSSRCSVYKYSDHYPLISTFSLK